MSASSLELLRNLRAEMDKAIAMLVEAPQTKDSDESDDDESLEPCDDIEIVERSRKIYFANNQRVNVDALMRLNQFYREESSIRNRFQKFFLSRMTDNLTPAPVLKFAGGHELEMLEQGRHFTKTDYLMIGRAVDEKIAHNTNTLLKMTKRVRLTTLVERRRQIPRYAEMALEEWFKERGKPNLFELFWLTRALDLPRPVIEEFFSKQDAFLKRMKPGKDCMGFKRFLKQIGPELYQMLLDTWRERGLDPDWDDY